MPLFSVQSCVKGELTLKSCFKTEGGKLADLNIISWFSSKKHNWKYWKTFSLERDTISNYVAVSQSPEIGYTCKSYNLFKNKYLFD